MFLATEFTMVGFLEKDPKSDPPTLTHRVYEYLGASTCLVSFHLCNSNPSNLI